MAAAATMMNRGNYRGAPGGHQTFRRHHLVPVVMLSSCNSYHYTNMLLERIPASQAAVAHLQPAGGAAVATSHALDASHACGEGNICMVAMSSLRDGRQL